MIAFRKMAHPMEKDGVQRWETCELADTINVNDISETRVPILVCQEIFITRPDGLDGGKTSFTLSGEHMDRVTDTTTLLVEDI